MRARARGKILNAILTNFDFWASILLDFARAFTYPPTFAHCGSNDERNFKNDKIVNFFIAYHDVTAARLSELAALHKKVNNFVIFGLDN